MHTNLLWHYLNFEEPHAKGDIYIENLFINSTRWYKQAICTRSSISRTNMRCIRKLGLPFTQHHLFQFKFNFIMWVQFLLPLGTYKRKSWQEGVTFSKSYSFIYKPALMPQSLYKILRKMTSTAISLGLRTRDIAVGAFHPHRYDNSPYYLQSPCSLLHDAHGGYEAYIIIKQIRKQSPHS